jgi:hypothetical protein
MAEILKVVGQRLQTISERGEHPDPNLLNAFLERSLGKRERVQILEHLAACTDCRQIVSLSGAEPGVADAVPVVPPSPGWLSWPALRWGALVACVVVVGAVVTLRHKPETRQTAASLAGGKPAVETQFLATNGAVEKKVASLQMPKPEAKVALLTKQPTSLPKATNTSRANENHAAVAASPVEMAEARTVSPFAEMVPGRAKDASTESQDTQEKAIGEPSPRRRSMGAPLGAASLASNASVPANLVPRWTLSSDGTLQRSLDSGRSWQTIPVSSRTIFRALAANGLDIWVGGLGGALFHSSDAGQHWTQVRPAVDGETLADDIIGVEFIDTLQGKLTTSGGETWTTADAGQTWQKH